MNRSFVTGVLVGIFAIGTIHAKTPTVLKADLASIMPAGKKARMAWSYGSIIPDYRNGNKLYVCDSDSGVIRELVPGKTGHTFTGKLYHPHITNDGSRVIFTEWNNGETVHVVNWDGSGWKQVTNGYGSDYYYDATTKTDWVVRNDGFSYTSNLNRVNIDKTTEKVDVWTNPSLKMGDADDGIGVSADGKSVAMYYNINEGQGGDIGPGVALCPNGTIKVQTNWQKDRGCVLSIAPDNTDFMHQSNYHDSVAIYSGTTGNKLNGYATMSAIKAWATQNNKLNNGCAAADGLWEFDATRWSSTERDIVTQSMRFTNVNGFIVRLSDMKFVYLQDSTNCIAASDMDFRTVAISTGWKGAVSIAPVKQSIATPNAKSVSESYGINGRRIVNKQKFQGIAIRTSALTATGKLQISVE